MLNLVDEQVLAFASLCSRLGSIEKTRQSVPRSRKKEKSGAILSVYDATEMRDAWEKERQGIT